MKITSFKIIKTILKNFKKVTVSFKHLIAALSTFLQIKRFLTLPLVVYSIKLFKVLVKYSSLISLTSLFFNGVLFLLGYGFDSRALVALFYGIIALISEDIFTPIYDFFQSLIDRGIQKAEDSNTPEPRITFLADKGPMFPMSPNEENDTSYFDNFYVKLAAGVILGIAAILIGEYVYDKFNGDDSGNGTDPDGGNIISKTKEAIIAAGGWIWSHLRFGNTTTITEVTGPDGNASSAHSSEFFIKENILGTKIKELYLQSNPNVTNPTLDQIEAWHKMTARNNPYYKELVLQTIMDKDSTRQIPQLVLNGKTLPDEFVNTVLKKFYLRRHPDVSNVTYEQLFNEFTNSYGDDGIKTQDRKEAFYKVVDKELRKFFKGKNRASSSSVTLDLLEDMELESKAPIVQPIPPEGASTRPFQFNTESFFEMLGHKKPKPFGMTFSPFLLGRPPTEDKNFASPYGV